MPSSPLPRYLMSLRRGSRMARFSHLRIPEAAGCSPCRRRPARLGSGTPGTPGFRPVRARYCRDRRLSRRCHAAGVAATLLSLTSQTFTLGRVPCPHLSRAASAMVESVTPSSRTPRRSSSASTAAKPSCTPSHGRRARANTWDAIRLNGVRLHPSRLWPGLVSLP